MKRRKKNVLSGGTAWLLGLLGACCITGFVLWLQLGPISATARSLLRNPLLIALNLWPIAATLGLLVCLLGNVFYSASLTNLIWGLLSYINLLKVSSRGDPFVPGDLLLLTEGMEAVGSYSLELHLSRLLLILGISLGLWLLGARWKTPKIRLRPLIGVVLLGAFAVSMHFGYGNKALYESFHGPDRSNVPQIFEVFGFPYNFLRNFNLYPVDKPEGYSEAAVQERMAEYAADPVCPETRPNILMVMCEAFTDLPNLDCFTYSAEDNPIAAFNALAASEQTVAGHLVVSNTGAGTANTEFDILTGMMTNRMSPATTSAFRVVRRNLPSLPRALNQVGYHSFFLHPGQAWFYNRQSVYSYLGITDQTFREAFGPEDYKGNWISDAGFLRVLKGCIEEKTGAAPLFGYGVTIQNHQSYSAEKYGFVPEPPATELPLSADASRCLSVYFEGLRDGANMLRELTEYLNSREEPYLLVFFGDHQPNLGANYQAYQELGLNYVNPEGTEATLKLYEVPFLLWANDAYLRDNDLAAQAKAVGLEQGATLSSHYLGALTCRIAGFSGLDGYLDYLTELYPALPVDSIYGFMLPDGTCTDTLPTELEQLWKNRWDWQYYRLKTQRVE